jgi:tetratricopeptide (TPR) repeat protein
LSRIAHHYAEAGQLDQALQVVQTISDANQKADALYGIARHYAEAGQLEQALRVAQAIDNNADLKASALLQLADRYAEAGKLDRAIEVAQTTDNDARSKALPYHESLVITQKPDNLTGSSGRSKNIKPLSVEGIQYNANWIFPQIAREYAKAGQFDKALQVAQTIEDKGNKVKALTAIAGQYMARSQEEKASEILDQALQIVQARQPGQ